jgi:Protein of unknown function (DUF2505)
MDVRAAINYPKASPDQVFALAVDPKFRSAVCEATHAIDYHVDVDRHADDTATVTIRRTMPADVPDFAKKFVGETVDVLQIEEWAAPDANGQREAQVIMQIKGQPAKMTGTATTEAVGQGARTSIRGDLKVTMPFVGKKIEPEIAAGILAAIAKEQEVADGWLGEPA